MKNFLLFTFLLIILPSYALSEEASLKPFLKNYCYDCHNADKKKGKLNLEQLKLIEHDHENVLAWQNVVDQIEHHDMPPEDELQPKDEARESIVSTLQTWIDENKPKPAATVLRRLNKNEYINTIRDLFKIRVEDFSGASEFPADERHHNFINNGESLVTSSILLDQYMNAANEVVEKVLYPEREQPTPQKLTFTPPFLKNKRDLSSWYYGKGQYQDLVFNESGIRIIYLYAEKFKQGVPERGYYNINLTVEAKNRTKDHPKLGRLQSPSFFEHPQEKLSVTVYAGTPQDGDFGEKLMTDKFVSEFELPDDQPHVVKLKVWLEKGQAIKFGFPQGIDKVKKARHIVKKHSSDTPKLFKQADPNQFKGKNNQTMAGSDWATYMQIHSKIYPTLRFYKFDVEGPFYETWPHKPVQHLLGDSTYDKVNLKQVIEKLATKAFRRPTQPSELVAIQNYVQQTYIKSGSKREALANGIRAILCSPQFYYLYENEGELDDFSLATRLSYFIWSSMPDDTLMELAKTNQLSKNDILEAQVERMLSDPRSKALTQNLANQWLGLYKLGSMPPDSSTEKEYYRRKLTHHSKHETYALLDYILKNNRNFMELLNADYTFLNKSLAYFYNYKNFTSFPTHQYVKTSLRNDYRKGLFGHMGLHTANADGIDTSPIIRGLWVYETILGKSAPEPPDSVAAIEPDIRNAKTIRDELELHRSNQDCMVCHQKFDHFGFALENFDALGRWRTDYIEEVKEGRKVQVKSVPIESFGKMQTGEKFKDINGLRDVLTSKHEEFSHTIVSKLLTLGIGREINSLDRTSIESISKEGIERSGGLKDLLKAVVTSSTFRTK